VILLALFMIGFTFVLLSKPLGIVYEHYVHDPELASDQEYQNMYGRLYTIWYWMPFIGVIMLLLWAYQESQRQDQMYG